jgi:hypothetical protein
MDTNRSFCQYVKTPPDDCGTEALRIFLPTSGGYINYNIVHSVMQQSKCDTWRLSVVYYCNGDFERVKPLTRSGAEWEMALKLSGRPDFIGGYAHGDEVYERIVLKLDGEEKEITSLEALTEFGTLSLEVWSVGYDPLDSTTESIRHYKKIIVDGESVRVEQEVEWLESYQLGTSYMAMFPPFKNVTDSYYTNTDTEKKPIRLAEPVSSSGSLDTLYLCGESGFTFSLQVEKYLDGKENTFLITDNGGVPYNKMYFVLPHRGEVSRGEIWKTVTVYTVNKKNSNGYGETKS